MARYVTGRELGRRLCEVLGINPNGVTSVWIDCTADDFAGVTVERYVTSDEAEELLHELRRYRLVDEDEG